MHRTPVAALALVLALTASACGDSSSEASTRTPTTQPTATFTPTGVWTPTFGPSPTYSPTSCVGVAPTVEPITSPTTRGTVRVRGTGVTCGNNKRVTIEGPQDQFVDVQDCVHRNVFDVPVRLDVGDNTITICQRSLCGAFCTVLEVERRRG